MRARLLGATFFRTSLAGLTACIVCTRIGGQGNPGEILFSSKISQTSGGFTGTIENGQHFGDPTVLGDLNGDGVDELAVSAPGDGVADSVFILFMNSDGTVQAPVVEIGDGQGGFPSGLLGVDDRWGSLAAIGDLDGDGISELAVGAQNDDDGSSDTGALWILFLTSAGTVKSSPPPQLFSATSGLTGLDPGGGFGVAVEPVGDLDLNGVPDLAVGAYRDDLGLGESFVGAVWFLFLDYSNGVVSVIAQAKVSKDTPALSGSLGGGDLFGAYLSWFDPIQGAPVLAVSSHGDDDSGPNEGAIYLLRLAISGTTVDVISHIKIREGVPGFPGPLVGDTDFPFGLTNIGDVDGNGTSDLGAGAPRDSGGLPNAGAVWVLLMNSDGSVLGQRKISPSGLASGDAFGSEIALLGDSDRDGRINLAVSAKLADDGGADRGAFYLLSLNDGSIDLSSVTIWKSNQGANNDDWDNSGHWNNGVPTSSATAIIPPGTPADPIIRSGDAAACKHLIIQPGASVTLQSATSSLAIHGGATLHGPILGSGPVTLAGVGTLAGTSDLATSGGVTANANITVQGGPLHTITATTLTVNRNFTIEAGAELQCNGTLNLASGILGTLSGSGTLDCDGPVTLNTLSTAPPRLEFSRDVAVNSASFDPISSTVVFDGGVLQTVTQTGGSIQFEFADLELAVGSDVLFDGDLLVHGETYWSGDGESMGSMEFEGNVTGDSASIVLMVAGGDIEAGGPVFGPMKTVLDPSMFVRFNTAGGLVVNLDQPIQGDVEVVGGGTLTIAGGDFGATGDLDILDARVISDGDLDLTILGTILIDDPVGPGRSELDVQGNHIDVLGNPQIDVFGDLLVGAGGELAMTVCPVVVASGGRLRMVGMDEAPAALQEADSTLGGFTVEIQSGAMLEAKDFLVRRPGFAGLKILDAATSLGAAPFDLREGRFDSPAGTVNARLLDIDSTAPIDLLELSFSGGTPGTNYNVRVPSTSSRVRLYGWGGGFGGPAFEFPTDDFAEWGTSLSYLTVREQTGVNTVFWRTRRQGEVVEFVLERATGAGAYGTIAQVLPTAPPQLYVVSDAAIAPATKYRYRLSERFPGGTLRELGIVRTDGVPNPPGRRGSLPPSVAPLQSASGGVSGPAGIFESVQDALDATGSSAPVLTLSLAAGTYPAFTVRGRSVRLQPTGDGEVVIDCTRGPIRIEGLEAGQSVELTDLVLVTTSVDHPALLVEDCCGIVLLEGIEATDVRLVNARAVVLEDCELSRVRITRSSLAFASESELGAVELAGRSRLESWGWSGTPERDPASAWIDHGRARPELSFEHEEGATLAKLAAEPGQRWWLLASPRLGFTPSRAGLPLLLDKPFLLRQGGSGSIDPTGSARRAVLLPSGLIGVPLYLQALVLDPESGRVSLSNVQRAAGTR